VLATPDKTTTPDSPATLPDTSVVQVERPPHSMTGDEMLNFELTLPNTTSDTTPEASPDQHPTPQSGLDNFIDAFDNFQSAPKSPVAADDVFSESGFLDIPERSAELNEQKSNNQALARSAPDTGEILELSEADFNAHFSNALPTLETPASKESPNKQTNKTEEIENREVQTDDSTEDQIKFIDDLRISIPLYNVYLNEADEWSRRLVTEMSEWSIERQLPVGDKVIALAHSLAGSSATVGFQGLSSIARALEHGLQKSQTHHETNKDNTHIDLFVKTAEEIRRLLHQFAAGFLKKPDANLLAKLKALDYPEPPVISPIQEPLYRQEAVEYTGQRSASKAFAATPLADPSSTALPAFISDMPEAENAAPMFAQEHHSVFENLDLDLDLDLGLELKSDDIDAQDAIDTELFPIFDEEVEELMPQLGGALRQWSAKLDNLNARSEVLRLLHTLKGSARLTGAMRLGEMAHRMESEIDFQGSDAAAEQDFDGLLSRFDAMQQNLELLRAAGKTNQDPDPLTVKAITEHKLESDPTSEPIQNTVPQTSSVPEMTKEFANAQVPAPVSMQLQPLRQAATANVRVRAQLLDRMVNQAGEIMITRSRLEVEIDQLRGSLGDLTGNLNRLRQQLREIELQAETQMQSRLAQAKDQADFDPLEFDRFTQVQELTRMMAESVNDVATVQRTLQNTVQSTEDELVAQARQTRELQRDLLRTRMVEFDVLSERLYRLVRQTAKESGKQVRLDLVGANMEMDRGMLERLTPAFEHLLRNCVAHGIESPELRLRANKDASGLITIDLHQEGNDVSLTISDDGAGLDFDRIREKALALGLMQAEQPLSDKDAADLIFQPGFSTATELTELSGRGIGLDVVRAEVNSVGGKIETRSQVGQSTHFKLVLPLTTAVTQVVMMRAAALNWGVPANLIETVRRVSAKELQQADRTGQIDIGGERLPFFWSGALLQSSQRSAEVQSKTAPVVVLSSASQRIALHVDEVIGNREVVVKNLGPQLSQLPGLTGMSVLASGAVVLIYNPVALSTIYGAQAKRWRADSVEPQGLMPVSSVELGIEKDPLKPDFSPPAPPSLAPLILVVDDSITVRRVTQRLLQREGFRVTLAADGLQALQCLQAEVPSVVLSDIEMPRMDGFDLARNIRGDTRLAALPIIMITSRMAEKHHKHAMELGVNHYLGKPFSEDELMKLVKRYCAPTTAS
jgi:chemosensory pili system protein ChpA (sensor histidine kinase/response regulator)